MSFRWHVLFWGTLYYFLAMEGVYLGSIGFYPVTVLLPWYWLHRSHLFQRTGHESWLSIHPWLWIRFIGFFVKEFVLANWNIIKLVWSPRALPTPVWVDVETQCRSPFGHMLVANFISLTPGTISWKIQGHERGATISVHCVNEADVEGLHALIPKIERYVIPMCEPQGPRAHAKPSSGRAT